jgi:hypothetical protein
MQEMSAAHAQPETAEPADISGRGEDARAAGGHGNGNGHAVGSCAAAEAAVPATAVAAVTTVHAAPTAVSVNSGEADLATVPVATATVTPAMLNPADQTPAAAVHGSSAKRAAASVDACPRTLATGYVLVLAGFVAIPFAPELRSTLLARCVLVGCFAALIAGAGLVVWGFVRDALGRRRAAATAKPPSGDDARM